MPYCPNPECIYFKDIGEPAEYVDGIHKCIDCKTKLVLEEPCFDVEETGVEEDLVDVIAVDDLPTAEMLKDILHEHGIDSVVEGGGDHISWGCSGSKIKIKVPSSMLSTALPLIKEVLEEEEEEGFECSDCGLAVGEEDKVCPGCGARF